ncbi:MAG: type I-G CRISPR-associated RAMP protein Csb1/Cas7g [Phycisphaerae bacterium]
MSEKLTLEILTEAVKNAAALRCITELQPAGGPGDKVFPPTYMGGVYATETRLIDGRRMPCVLLDSVQSQANRMELALLQAWRDKRISIPVITVDFSGHELREVGRNFRITSLDAPHRIADAILRDSIVEANGQSVPFSKSDYAKRWGSASLHNATELFRLCPTALVFGTWGSPEKPGGLGPKFPRAIVSEIVAIDVEFGVKTSSRIDPLGIPSNAAVIYAARNGGWTMNPDEAELDDKKKPILFGSGKSTGKPSAINHGNIPPDVSKWGKAGNMDIPLGGGVTMDHAAQTTVLSLSALRRLEFPVVNGGATPAHNFAARTALAALGICAATLARADGDLRSRCQLHPVKTSQWEIVAGAGAAPPAYDLSPDEAVALLISAAEAATRAGIPWQDEEIRLKPSPNLVELVKRSQEVAGEGNSEESSEA